MGWEPSRALNHMAGLPAADVPWLSAQSHGGLGAPCRVLSAASVSTCALLMGKGCLPPRPQVLKHIAPMKGITNRA